MTRSQFWGGAAVAAGVAIAGFGAGSRTGVPDGASTALARRGSLIVSMTESGVLRAGQSTTYRSPIEGREVEVTWLAPEGTLAAAGDVLARLDASALVLDLDRARQSVRQVEMQMAAARLQRDEALMADRSVTSGAGKLVIEESRTELRLLEARAKRLRAAYEQLRPLFSKGYITRDELERSAAEAEEAEARAELEARAFLVLTEQTQPATEQAARLQVARRDADLANLQPQLDSARAYVQSLESFVERCTILAISPGLIVYDENLTVEPRRKVRAGDRVTPSQGLVTLPNLSAMAVEASVREADVMLVVPGARVRVRLDALPDAVLTGRVARVGAIARPSASNASESRFEIGVDVDSSPLPLRPAMNVRIDIDVTRPEAVIVPVTAVRNVNGQTECIVEKDGRLERRSVTLGRSNLSDVEVISGVAAGERVRLGSAPGN